MEAPLPSLNPYQFITERNPDGSIRVDSHGRPCVAVAYNPVKDSITSFHEVLKELAITLSAGGNDEGVFQIDSQGSFEWTHILGVSTGPYTVELFDPADQGRLSNFPMHSGTIVGTARRPFELPDPYLFNVEDKRRELIAKFHDLSGAPNTVRLYLYGRRYYTREAIPDVHLKVAQVLGRKHRINNYFMVPKEVNQFGVPAALGPLARTTCTFTADHGYDTSLMKLMASSTGPFAFNLREKDTNRTLSNRTIHSDNGWGTAQFPFRFADTWLIERDKQLLCEVTDISGAPNTIFLTMAGRRLKVSD